MLKALLAAAPISLLAAPPASAQVGGPLTDVGVVTILNEMADWIEPCVQPTASPRVFTLCLDTHSSIHAHWAAYRIARALPDRHDLALTSEHALEFEKVRNDFIYMQYPYARAWFLRLAIEYESWCLENARPDPERLRTFADELAVISLQQLETGPIDPTIGEYSNPSWHLVQLHAWYAFIGDASGEAATADLIDRSLVRPIRGVSFGSDLNSAEFFSRYGNWCYAVLKSRDAATVDDFLAMQAPIPDAHLHVNGVSTRHSYGMGWSRTWALVALSRAHPDPLERLRFRRAAARHVAAGMKRHEALKGDFVAYDHWVPQFAVYAVTEGLDLP